MSKRTPATSKTSDAPKTRTRAAKPAAQTAEATPKAPRTRRKAQPAAEVAAAAESALVAVTRSPTHDEIATRAYFIALERGFSSDPTADWLTAERELSLV
jgi:hypothetical protein